MANTYDLAGRVAVVTGGAQGIGRAVSSRLIASGAKVAIWDRDADLAGKTAAEIGPGGKAFAIACDMSDFASVSAASAATVAQAGRIDILVNNAGISGPNATVADYPVEAWKNVIDLDLNGVFYGCKAVVPTMVAQGAGVFLESLTFDGDIGAGA